jgi:hypothetical protein
MSEYPNLVLANTSELNGENHTETRQCLNCGEILPGLYCTNCGQKDVSYSKPLGSVLSLFFDSWFSVDNRTLRSIFPLLFKPGYLSAQFVAGRRMSYASPIKLYLFSSICYFFLFNISLRTDSMADAYSAYNEKMLNQALLNQQDAINKAEALRNTYRADLPANKEDTASNKEDTPSIKEDTASNKEDTASNIEGAASNKEGALLIPKTSVTSNVPSKNKLAGRIGEKVKNPENLRSSLIKGFSYMFFVLMPLFALLLKWIMGKKKQYYFDHLVLAVHFHAFALLFFSFLLLTRMILGLTITEYLFLVAVLYFIVSVKRFYCENWVRTIARSIVVIGVYVFFFTIVLVSTSLIIIAL